MQNNNPKLSTICTLKGMFVLGASVNLTVLVFGMSPPWLFQAAQPTMAMPLIALIALIVFAALFGWILWGQTLGVMAIVGIGLIMVSAAITAVRS